MRSVCLFAMSALVAVGVAVMPSGAAVIVADDGLGWTAVSAIPPTPQNTTITDEGVSSVHSTAVLGGTSTGVQLDGLATLTGIHDDLVFEATDLVIDAGGTVGGTPVYQVAFDFYTGSTAYNPATLSLYFQTTSYSWYYDLVPPSTAGWNSYSVYFTTALVGAYSTDGGPIGGGLADVGTFGATQAGLRILYPANSGPYQYGIGNFQYLSLDPPTWAEMGAIPEPGTYVMLSTALMSLGYSYAKRRRDQKKAVAA